MSPFGNIKLLLAALISFAVLAAAVTVPQLCSLFDTVRLTSQQMLTALGLSAAVPLLSGIFSAGKKSETR